MSHPNRSKANRDVPPASPSAERVREIRAAAGLSQTEAAKLVHVTLTAWQRWECTGDLTSARRMPAACWELFLLHCRRHSVALPPALNEYINRKWG